MTAIPVDAYQAEVHQTLLAEVKTGVPVHYRFEWEIYDSDRYKNSRADKAQLQDRARDTRHSVLRKYAAVSSETVLMRLAAGEDGEQALAIALKPTH